MTGRRTGATPPGDAEEAKLAVVLTGGHSSRMGVDKATVVLGGRRMVDHVIASCRTAGLEVRVAGPPTEGLEEITLADPAGIRGPAAGLAAAMRAYPGLDIVLLATDQPYVRPATLAALVATPGSAVVPLDGRRQTVCAVYRSRCAEELERLLEERSDPSLQTLLDKVGATAVEPIEWMRWGEDGRSWLSLDTPELVAAAANSWPAPPIATIPP